VESHIERSVAPRLVKAGAFSDLKLWVIDLAAEPSMQEEACLSEAELDRARRFAFARDRRRFVVARAALRTLLADYTGEAPERLRIVAGREGKPRLEGSHKLAFNLSHSEDRACIVVASGQAAQEEIGVDIEVLHPIDDMKALARFVFTPTECMDLERVDPTRLDAAFLRIWTRKEACLKAIGSGLTIAPAGFEVGLDPADSVVTVNDGPVRRRVALSCVDVGGDAVCAVARVKRDAPPGYEAPTAPLRRFLPI
jgi:4'-phosphopantetheinyl transferase